MKLVRLLVACLALPLALASFSFAAEELAPAPRALEQVSRIQSTLREAGLDGWLFFDFRGTNPIAQRILLLQSGGTRRWFYFVPANGAPVRVVHAIEPHRLDTLPGTKTIYGAWPTLQAAIRETLAGKKKIAMEYSPNGAIPYVARVDAGTIDFVRSTGVEVVTSGDLVAKFEAVWSEAQREQHDRAAKALRTAVNEAWAQIATAIRAGNPIDERAVQAQCVRRMTELGVTDEAPIVAVNANAADPHYFPVGPRSSPIKRGDLVLIDIVGKVKEPGAVYADITWMGVVDETVPERFDKIWKIVAGARDAAIEFIRAGARRGQLPTGAEVDDVCRGVIAKAGYAERFIHRTGHSIGEEVHGNGTHIDNFETNDTRRLLPRTCFSIEPGIYLTGDFGIRSEVDVYLDGKDAIITGGPAQTAIVPILGRSGL
jgi:Xaa-Pro dipeptidase